MRRESLINADSTIANAGRTAP